MEIAVISLKGLHSVSINCVIRATVTLLTWSCPWTDIIYALSHLQYLNGGMNMSFCLTQNIVWEMG